MSKKVAMKITVTVYRDGMCRIDCDGGDVDCKIATYAIQQALKLVDYVSALILMMALSRRAEDKGKNTGIM